MLRRRRKTKIDPRIILEIISKTVHSLSVHPAITWYVKDPKLILYFSYIIMNHNKQMSTGIKHSDWFRFHTNKIPELPTKITNRWARTKMDKELVDLGLLEHKLIRQKDNKRFKYKFYRIKFNKVRKIIVEFYEQFYSEKPCRKMRHAPQKVCRGMRQVYNTSTSTNNPSGLLGRLSSQSTDYPTEYLHDQEVLKKRRKSLEHEIIAHWCSKGKPFAQLRNDRPMLDILKPMVTGKPNLSPKQYIALAKGIIDTIDIAHQYFTHNYFLFRKKSSFGMKAFFTPISAFQQKLHSTVSQCTYLNGKRKTWYNLFKYASKSWLNANMLHNVNLPSDKKSQQIVAALCDYFNLSPKYLDREQKLTIKRVVPVMSNFIEANDIAWNFFTLLDDYEKFKRPIKMHQLAYKNFYNNQFTDFLIEGNHRERVTPI